MLWYLIEEWPLHEDLKWRDWCVTVQVDGV